MPNILVREQQKGISGPGGVRTHDHAVMSRVLLPLSYRPLLEPEITRSSKLDTIRYLAVGAF